jgi:hypothetical protein
LSPAQKKRLAQIHFWASLVFGVLGVVFLAEDTYDRVLLGISFYAITITAWDVWQTADVRKEQDAAGSDHPST